MTCCSAVPENESERLAALYRYGILDTEREASFDRIVRLAARQFDVPIALITFLDEDRQWFKATWGLEATEGPRHIAFCARTILSYEPLVVLDATKDPRFADHPLVTDGLRVRFYAGAPLTDRDGCNLGTLCLVDTKPHDVFSDHDRANLEDLAGIIVDRTELRRATADVLTDIEVREQAREDQWRTAQSLHRTIFSKSRQQCALLDAGGKLIDANESALAFAGLTGSDVIGRPLWHTDLWRTADECRQDFKGMVAQVGEGRSIQVEFEVPDRSGNPVQIDFSMKPVLGHEDTVVMLLAEASDISEQRRYEQQMRQNEAETALILNNVPVRIFYKDDKNRILRLNEPAARSMGMSVSEAEGADTYDLFPEVAEKYHRDDLEVINSGRPKLGIIEAYAPRDGQRGWVRTDKVPYVDPDTGEQYVFVAATDITAEKEAEEATLAIEKKYQQLYNKTPVMLHSIDRSGRLLSVSDFWLEHLGYTRDEVIGRASIDFLSPESAKKAVNEVIPRFMKMGVVKDVEYQFVTKSGELMDVLLSGVAEYDNEGEMTQSMAVVTDITERKSFERKFIQAQKMESVGQLTGGLAHDFNNLLGVISGNLQLIEAVGQIDADSGRRITAALRAVERGAELTRRLLAFSRRQKLETKSVDPNALLSGLAEMLKRTLGEAIALDCPMETVPHVRADPSQLESSILNLAVNARDAMPNGGTLTIVTSVVHLDEDDVARETDVVCGDYVLIAVNDTGIGIPDDILPKVIEPFFTTKDVGRGSGLGLSMVYGFLQQSGGHLRIHSEVARGTSVRMFLPVDPHACGSETAPATPSITDLHGRETVLVVEDNTEVREVAVALLENLGYTVLEAGDGQSALSVLRTDQEVDLLFTDIVMPGGLDGMDLAKATRMIRPNLPVVFATGYAEAAMRREGEIITTDNLVTKPYRRLELAAKLRTALAAGAGQRADTAAGPTDRERRAG